MNNDIDESRIAYLDNAATTPTSPHAIEAMNEVLQNVWGNPSSAHGIGRIAKERLEWARGELADCLGVDPSEIYFTSGSTESNNLAIHGACMARKAEGGSIITSSLEHASVTRSIRGLRRQGWVVHHVEDPHDNFDMGQLRGFLADPTTLISVMQVQNELGWTLPVKKISEARDELAPNALLHCDATQAFGKIACNPVDLGCELLTVGAHKIAGPRGIGALYVKHGTKMFTTAFGGGQEGGLRSGTECVYLAVGFAVAAREACAALEANFEIARKLKERLMWGLNSVYPDAIINSKVSGSPYIVSVSLPGISNDELVAFLETRNVYVSKASACTNNHATVPKGTWRKKHPLSLQAAGIPLPLGRSTIRVSFSFDTTPDDIDRLLQGIREFQHQH